MECYRDFVQEKGLRNRFFGLNLIHVKIILHLHGIIKLTSVFDF